MNSASLQRWITRKLRVRHIELVAAIYDSRSIVKASRKLNLTQPAVTKALQDVEKILDVHLFERTNRGLKPTLFGETVARHAKIVLAQLRHAAEEVENLRAGYSGHVSIGTLLAASASLLPEAIAQLKEQRPAVAISVVEGTYDILLPALVVSDLDIVVGRLPDVGRMPELLYEDFYSEPIALVTRSGHPLAGRSHLQLADLVDVAWILPPSETALRRQIEKVFIDAHTPMPRNVIESVSILTNRSLLKKTDCICLTPYHVALDDVEHGILAVLPIRLGAVQTPVGAMIRRPGDLPPAASALLSCLRTVGKRLRGDTLLPGR